MTKLVRTLLFGTTALLTSSTTFSQSDAREPTDVYIRRLAGLSPESARGQIEIIDVGHNPLSTMLSVVGSRTDKGWAVSYACASSPNCAPDADHAAMVYTLSALQSAEVDRLINQLRNNGEPDGQRHAPDIISGYLHVRINVSGFKREYRRQMTWGKTLGRLEDLFLPEGR